MQWDSGIWCTKKALNLYMGNHLEPENSAKRAPDRRCSWLSHERYEHETDITITQIT